MKSLILTLFVFLCSQNLSFGQIDATIKEETKANSKGSFNALVMELPGTTDKEVNKAWSKFMKKYRGKTKFDRKVSEYITDDATVKEMSDNTVDILAKVEARGTDGTAVSVWFNLGVSYLSSKDHSERYPAGEKLLKLFANQVSADMIEQELAKAEKMFKELEEQLKKLEKEKTQGEKDIEDFKSTILKMEESIAKGEDALQKNDEQQRETTLGIEAQKTVVEEIKKRLESIRI
jgi:hypothetical protein